MANGEVAYTRKPGFTWGFEIARRLVEPGFRRRLSRARRNEGRGVIVPACPQEPLSDVLDRMTHHKQGLIIRWERR